MKFISIIVVSLYAPALALRSQHKMHGKSHPIELTQSSQIMRYNQLSMSASVPDAIGMPITPSIAPAVEDRIILGMNSKLRKRWATGLLLGIVATFWVFSGSGYFTLGFLLTSVIAQMEYYNMVKNTGVEPAIKTGIVSSLMCFLTAALAPQYHEFVMPLSATQLMLWLLIFNKKAASISEISSTFLGIFFMGYMPSFWVRLRALGEISPTLFPVFLQHWGWTQADTWTQGAVVTWWTWCSTVFADVGAYFVGKNFGKHKLSTISSAAGSASPNKTVEGALAGFLSCTLLSLLGAWLMQWPHWAITGSLYGLTISFVALIGDLTASMMKRDAKLKDSGSLLPGHGGLLDRFDSYMFTAPVAYLFCTLILPFAKRIRLKDVRLVIKV